MYVWGMQVGDVSNLPSGGEVIVTKAAFLSLVCQL